MNLPLKPVIAATLLLLCGLSYAQITLFEGDAWHGRSFSTSNEVDDLGQFGFNDRASSVIIAHGEWEICDDVRFAGKCIVLGKGSYPSLSSMNMNDRVSSVRPMIHHGNYETNPQQQSDIVYDYRPRPNEVIYRVPVTSVHAVYGPPEQRCWIERQEVSEPAHNDNIGGALIGGILGGVLGHQIGGGRGQGLATAGGAVAGALIGSNAGTSSGASYSRDVQRCQTVPAQNPDLWDVTYDFRGYEHHMQTRYAPGATVSVNGDGEPRQ